LKIIDDKDFEKRLERYLELEESKKEGQSLWKTITERAKASSNNGVLNQLVGKYRVTGKTGSSGSFTTKIDII